VARAATTKPNPTLKLSIQYFALLRDQRGQSDESLETTATTPQALYEELAQQHGFTLPRSALKVAVNDEFATWNTALADSDSIVFIPPVAGG